MNNVCKGIVMTEDTLKEQLNGDSSLLDPTGLIVREEYDEFGLSDVDINKDTWEEVVSACKAWAEWFGEVLCCQHIRIGDESSTSLDAFVVKTSEVVAQEKMEFPYPDIDLSTFTFYGHPDCYCRFSIQTRWSNCHLRCRCFNELRIKNPF